MGRLAGLVAALIIGCGFMVSPPSAQAGVGVRGAEARTAVEAALAHARLRGMTYELRGEVRQRNARGDVAVAVSGRTVSRIVVGNGASLSLLEPAPATASRPRISRAVLDAYRIAPRAYVQQTISPADEEALRAWFDPLSGLVEDATAEVVVDDAGRATAIELEGETVVRVLRWDAPLATQPALDRIVTGDTWATAAAIVRSADFIYGLADQLASIAGAHPDYSASRVRTLRGVARSTGWQAREAPGGLAFTVTDALGARWEATLIAQRGGVRVYEFTLTSHPQVMAQERALTRLALGVTAMGQSDLMSCPASCRQTGRAAPLRVAEAERQLIARLRNVGVVGQTPGPDYPRVGSGMRVSFGLLAADGGLGGSLSLSVGGLCVAVPITGPGVLLRPTTYEARPGQVGPWGTCVR